MIYENTTAHKALTNRLDLRKDVELFLLWCEFLDPLDRAIMHQVYEHGQTFDELAAFLGVTTKIASNRVNTTAERVRSPAYRFIVRNFGVLPAELRVVADMRFLRGYSRNWTVKQSSETLATVRIKDQAIQWIIDATPALVQVNYSSLFR